MKVLSRQRKRSQPAGDPGQQLLVEWHAGNNHRRAMGGVDRISSAQVELSAVRHQFVKAVLEPLGRRGFGKNLDRAAGKRCVAGNDLFWSARMLNNLFRGGSIGRA